VSKTPIADYALLSDCPSAALVSREGSVDWLCFPRFDRPSVFARILDDEAGHWSISAPGMAELTRRYLEHTMVLETAIRTGTGAATLTEGMSLDADQDGHDLGSQAPRGPASQGCVHGG
jgi:alpha,alpha-trehalase